MHLWQYKGYSDFVIILYEMYLPYMSFLHIKILYLESHHVP